MRRETAKRRLIPFAQYVDPMQADNYAAKHMRLIASYLEAVERGEIKRLIINIPPRHWKTSLIEKFLPWYLGRHPLDSVIDSSYSETIPLRSSSYIRDMIETNERFQELFGIALDRDSRDKHDWKLTGAHRTSFRAVGVGGGVTGGGANIIIVDDPIKDWAESRSEVILEKTWDWFNKTLYTRQEPGAAIIIVMTRWSEGDPTGRVLQSYREEGGEGWVHVKLPAIAVDENDPLGRKPGEALWPQRWPPEALKGIETQVGPLAWALTYQQEDAQDEGVEIKKEWFKYWPVLPQGAKWRARAWDLAMTEKQLDKNDPDFTASVKGTTFMDKMWLGAPIIFRANWGDVVSEIMRTMYVESDIAHGTGKSMAETAAVQALQAQGYWLDQYDEKGDKRTRAAPWINEARKGKIELVGTEAEWAPFLKWWWKFPIGTHDDSIDCTSGLSQMLNWAFIETADYDDGDEHDGLSLDRLLKMAFGKRHTGAREI